MIDPFHAQMIHLDGLVEQCRRDGAFGDAIIRDTSNRSDRDWPWWSVKIERTREDGARTQRVSAEIRLNVPAPGTPSAFEALWSARIWYGTNTDSFRAAGQWPLQWTYPSADDLETAVILALRKAGEAISNQNEG